MFYRRIFRGVWFNRISILLILLVVAWIIAFFFGNLFQCLPLSINWNGVGSTSLYIKEIPLYLGQAYSDVITDVLILALPVPWGEWNIIRCLECQLILAVWKLHMSVRTKIAVTGVFLLGGLYVKLIQRDRFARELIELCSRTIAVSCANMVVQYFVAAS